MSQQEQPQRLATYGDVFGEEAVKGEVAAQPVTVEDAALMQSAEAIALGGTEKGGAAARMQAAADRNVRDHIVDPALHSEAAERGFGIRETMVDGRVHRQEVVGDQPVTDEVSFVPTIPEIAATQGVTIGEALEEAASHAPEFVVDKETARAIQSAEARATGIPLGFKEGLGATAQAAAQKNEQQGAQQIKLGYVLGDATERMLLDKVATPEDVQKVQRVDKEDGVIASALQNAVDANANAAQYLEAQAQQRPLPQEPAAAGQQHDLEQPKTEHVD